MTLARFCLAALILTEPAIAAPTADMNQAFQVAFGHAAPYAMTAGDAKTSVRFLYTPSGLVPVAPGLVALISKGKASCTGCSGTLAVHYLKHDGHGYALAKVRPAIVPAASWTVRADLDRVPVLLAAHDEGGQDCHETYSQLIALMPDRPVVQANLLMAVDYDPGPEPDRSPGYAAKAKLLPEARGERFALQYAGTWKLRVDYARKGDVYVAQQREAPACQ